MIHNLSFWSVLLNLIILVVSVSCFVKIMKNDLVHVQSDLKELKSGIIKLGDKVDEQSGRISKIEGILSVKNLDEKK